MDDSKQFESNNEEHQNIIDDQTRCCLCGTELSFKHEVDYLTLQVREHSDCPSCKIQMKTKNHGLH